MEPPNKKRRPSQRAPSSREILSLVDKLGLPDEVTRLIYEAAVFIPMTRYELRASIGDFIRDPSGLPPINSWDVSNVTNFHWAFAYCESFNEDISGWDVSQAIKLSCMFYNCIQPKPSGLGYLASYLSYFYVLHVPSLS